MDYEMRYAEIRELLADINRNYQWVLGAVALIVGSQTIALQWPQLRDLVLDQPWILLVASIALLWFPAYDITRWVDFRVTVEYVREELEPRLRGSAQGADWRLWEGFRNDRLHVRRGILLPIWLGKFSLPYAPTLLLFGTGIWALTKSPDGPTVFEVLLLLVWAVMTVISVVGIVRAAVLVPTRA